MAILPFAKRICEMLMTVSEVAEYLKVRKETVYGWIKDREIAAIYLDRAIRIDERDLAIFISQRRKDAKK
jgi:excisionase family DNA binding protein